MIGIAKAAVLPVTVCAIPGKCIYHVLAQSEKAQIALPERGVYIVIAGEKAMRVVS